MKWPGVREIAKQLKAINRNVEGECDVRLQVYPDGKWWIRSGDAQFDQDHSGYWGASSIPGTVGGEVMEFNAQLTARFLLDQAQEARAEQRAVQRWSRAS